MPVLLSGASGVNVQGTQVTGAPGGASAFFTNAIHNTSNNTLTLRPPISIYGDTPDTFTLVISASYTTPQNLRALAVAAGWNQSSQLLAVISSGVAISSNSTSSYALTIAGSFPKGVVLTNNGYIVGMGGAGGNTTAAGSAGGPALSVSTAVTIANFGTIAGGGGGGGAGVFWSWNGLNRSTPGSGGASGHTQAAAGGGGPHTQGAPSQGPDGVGLYSTPGPSQNWGWGGRASSPGGKGGSWGAAGDAGGTVDGNYNYSGYAGGAGGAAVAGNSYITWTATGTRAGAIA